MMMSVKGKVQNGVVQPDELVTDREGQEVIITFVEEKSETSVSNGSDDPAANSSDDHNDSEAGYAASWDRLMDLIERCQMDTGIEDLAYQHDHYLYGKPKQD